MARDGRDGLITQLVGQLDEADARLASTGASEQFWRQKAREYRTAVHEAEQEARELREVATQMAPVSDSALAASTLLVSIHATLNQDRSDRVIDSIVRMIEDHWRETDQLRP